MYQLRRRTSSHPGPRVSSQSEERQQLVVLPHCSSSMVVDDENDKRSASTMFVKTPNMAAVFRPRDNILDSGSEQLVVKRTVSGSLLLRNRTRHSVFQRKNNKGTRQQEASRARSQDLSAWYELSNELDKSLCRTAVFQAPVVRGPTLTTITAKQAAAAFVQNAATAAPVDPYLQTEYEHRQDELKMAVQQRKTAIARRSSSGQFQRTPLATLQAPNKNNSNNAGKAFTKPGKQSFQKKKGWTKMVDTMPESNGMEIVALSPTAVSVAPTEPETPSPKAAAAETRIRVSLPRVC